MDDNASQQPPVEEEDEIDIVVFEDAEGNEFELALLSIVEVDSQQYALMTPPDHLEPGDESENMDVFVFRYTTDPDGSEVFEAVDDEATVARVEEASMDLFEYVQ